MLLETLDAAAADILVRRTMKSMLPKLLLMLLVALSGLPLSAIVHAEEPADVPAVLGRENLVAWCIVPFDKSKRSPEDRAAMLRKLGFTKFAYDYRAEHVPTFDAEIESLQRERVELFAWWFPTTMNPEAESILRVIEKHKIHPQLWVMGSGGKTTTDAEQATRVQEEAARIRVIAERAKKLGLKVGLYNHGGWFGEPENQLAVIEALAMENVGIVYNLHHGHDHLARFPKLLEQMKPKLLCLNLNGMVPDGERQGQKILPLGQGSLDLDVLQTIVKSGYSGPIGIIGHTQDDAEARLLDNLDGLSWLTSQMNADGDIIGNATSKPTTRTPFPARK